MASIDEHLVSALSSVMRSLERPLAIHIAAVGLTATQFTVLERLLHKGPQTVNDLIRGLLSTGGNMAVVIDNLISAGLLLKTPNPADGRSRIINLTEAGRKKINDYYPAHKSELTRLLGGIPALEKKQLIKQLATLRRNLEGEANEQL